MSADLVYLHVGSGNTPSRYSEIERLAAAAQQHLEAVQTFVACEASGRGSCVDCAARLLSAGDALTAALPGGDS